MDHEAEQQYPDTFAVVVAAGASLRFGSDKLAARLGATSVLASAVHSVRRGAPEAPVALVVRPDAVDSARAVWEPTGARVVAGGPRRQDSVANGVRALAPADRAIVVIHDGARPFVPPADVRAVVAAARESGAALLAAPVVDTVKQVDAAGRVAATVPRHDLVRALTPQAFRAGLLRSAWSEVGTGDWTDEAAMVEAVGFPVQTVPGDPRNIKVTRPEDLSLLAGLYPAELRVGQGTDVHPFEAGRRLVLCGVEIPSDVGLAGHSDADAVLHAVADAILGACGAGDIGEHFPPSDERWRGAESGLFVRRAIEMAAARGLRVGNCDVTVLAERPRIGPHREAMRTRLATLLGVEVTAVNIKATTFEGLGFIGRTEGLAATAVVTLGPL